MNYMAMADRKTGDMLDEIEGIMNLAAASGENPLAKYLLPMKDYVKENHISEKDANTLIMTPTKLIIYIGRDFILPSDFGPGWPEAIKTASVSQRFHRYYILFYPSLSFCGRSGNRIRR